MGKMNLLKKIAGYRGVKKRAGFTLIEVVVAMAILLIIVVSVLMLATVSASSLKDSEARDMAKNIATYTVEYLRARNVTYPDNSLGHPQTDFVYLDTIDPLNPFYHYDRPFPGLVDLWDSPPLNPSPLKPTNSASDTINIRPALPSQNYNTTAFYSSIQGYVSLTDNPADSDPSSEDGNAKVVTGKYYDIVTGAPYVVRFPLNSSSSNAIKNFTALSTSYNAKIYTTDKPTDTNSKTNPSSSEYDSHYTNDATGTMAYRGFRVLTQIVARVKADPNHLDEPMKDENGDPIQHVQYYDVKVTVFWILGSKEHSYSLATQITTYGGS